MAPVLQRRRREERGFARGGDEGGRSGRGQGVGSGTRSSRSVTIHGQLCDVFRRGLSVSAIAELDMRHVTTQIIQHSRHPCKRAVENSNPVPHIRLNKVDTGSRYLTFLVITVHIYTGNALLKRSDLSASASHTGIVNIGTDDDFDILEERVEGRSLRGELVWPR